MKTLALVAGFILFISGWPMVSTAEESRLVEVQEWKAVFARIETRDRIAARSQLGGILRNIEVSEGDTVSENEIIGLVHDEKLQLQMVAIEATMVSLESQLKNAETELTRGETLLARGSTTTQRVDGLRTEVEVLRGRISTVSAERDVVVQRMQEGTVLAPVSGRVLQVPVTRGSVVLPGEPVAVIGGGGFYLRLAVPERHAANLVQGDQIRIEGTDPAYMGTLAKVYPLIENGRVIADVEVDDLATDFVDARVLVRLPIGTRSALVVPQDAVRSRMGLDFVTVKGQDGLGFERAVVLGMSHDIEGKSVIEILSGLQPGETLVMNHD
ncbi:efflux RND transporter periplasmic adaptor subunit [Shimia sediminis]|uniref:efflux RND transporter periplasmic adaptor subunit n=1 Tax=Shimia sediminis TaxID=2497945 RepID=UPI000F8EA3C5|nr:efflux RND transporter periplasmic adaptor subunit [Shimia sediminis]